MMPLLPHPHLLPMQAEENTLSNTFQWYFANFAATGVPGAGNPAKPDVAWPAYSKASRSTLNVVSAPTAAACDCVWVWAFSSYVSQYFF